MGPLAELSRHHRSEESFRQEMADAIRPFVWWAAAAGMYQIRLT
jgi:hypothetical protein